VSCGAASRIHCPTGGSEELRTSAISDTTDVDPEVAKLQGIALASLFQIIISEAGRRTQKGHSPMKVARQLLPIVERILDELDRWFSTSGATRVPRRRRS
jgi:hypothetical protein